MAKLKPCQDCEHMCSTKAKTCPNCGRTKPVKAGRVSTGAGLIIIILAFGVISVIAMPPQPDPIPAAGPPQVTADLGPPTIATWLIKWSGLQAASTQETCRAETGCDPAQYEPSARPETSFGWDGPQSVEKIADWARGPRYRVRANGRSVLMYLEDGEVITVDMLGADGGRTNLCRDGSC